LQRDLRGEWEVIPAVVDSGAFIHVGPRSVASHLPIQETEASRRRVYYENASGDKVYNEGERELEGFSGDGVPMNLPMQIAKVSKPLFAVRKIKEVGNATLFGLDSKHAVINKETGKIVCDGGRDVILDQVTGEYMITEIKDKNKEYTIDLWIKKPKDNKSWDPVSKTPGRWRGNACVVTKITENCDTEDVDTTRPKGEVFSSDLIGDGAVRKAVNDIEKRVTRPIWLKDQEVPTVSTFRRQP